MESVLIPKEAANHLWAMLLLFDREISGRLLDEAEQLAAQGQTAPAVIIAGTVLEYLLRSPEVKLLATSRKTEVDAWRRLRDEAVHGLRMTSGGEDAHGMVQGVRELSVCGTAAEQTPRTSGQRRASAAHIKGKYAYVRTSADEFMRRKHEKVELQDRK